VNFKMYLTEKQIAQVFIATKFARNFHKEGEDNILDAINYLAIMDDF